MREPEEIYQELLPQLQTLEDQRKEVVQKSDRWMFGGLTVFIVSVLTLLIISANTLNPPFWILIIGFICLIAGLAVKFNTINKFKIEYKERVVKTVVSNINEALHYSATHVISSQDFRESQIFSGRADRYTGEDLIHGRYGKTDFRLSEVKAQERRQQHTKRGTRTYYVTIFEGLFMVADFHKHFEGRTFVLPDHTEKGAGTWFSKKLQYFSGGRGDLIYLENPEFEREFKVYGDDPVEARYILSTSMMEDILKLRRRFGVRIHLSFIRSNVYLAISKTKNFLEPDIKQALTERKTIFRLYEEVQILLSLIDDLNLNTRIWSKQDF